MSFEKLVIPSGELVSLDPKTESLDRLEFAKLQIRTVSIEPIAWYRKIRINDLIYGIRIVEETSFVKCEGACVCSMASSSSEDSSQWSDDAWDHDCGSSDDQNSFCGRKDEGVQGDTDENGEDGEDSVASIKK